MERYEGIRPSSEVQPVLPGEGVRKRRPDEKGPDLPKKQPTSSPNSEDTFETTMTDESTNLPDAPYPTYDKNGNLLPRSRSQD